jgi:hypothetical protein
VSATSAIGQSVTATSAIIERSLIR